MAQGKAKIVERTQKRYFYGITVGATTTFYQMRGFTEMSTSKNPKEYTRQYIDEEFERTDVTGYSVSVSYNFDEWLDDPVHEDIISITDNEFTGAAAVRSMVQIDLTKPLTDDKYPAIKRDFAVIPDSEGDNFEAYTYSGNFKVAGEKVFGEATYDAQAGVIIFTESV